MVPNLVSTIPAVALTSAFTIKEVLKVPELLVWTTPTEFNPSKVIVPVGDIRNHSEPPVLNDKVPADAERPVPELPVNWSDGDTVLPAGNTRVPVRVPPEADSFPLS